MGTLATVFGMMAVFLSNHIVIGISTLVIWLILYKDKKYEKGSIGFNIGTIFFLMIGFGLVISYNIEDEIIDFKNYFLINLSIVIIVSILCNGYFFIKNKLQKWKCPKCGYTNNGLTCKCGYKFFMLHKS